MKVYHKNQRYNYVYCKIYSSAEVRYTYKNKVVYRKPVLCEIVVRYT